MKTKQVFNKIISLLMVASLLLSLFSGITFGGASEVFADESSVVYPTTSWKDSASGAVADTDYVLDATAKTLEIKTATGLAYFAYEVNNSSVKTKAYSGYTVTLTGNIDLSDHLWTAIGYYTGGQEYVAFSGTFDGAGYTISGMNVSIDEASGDVNTGLFGYVYSGTVKNLSVDGSITVTVGPVNAGIVAQACNSKIIDCDSNIDIQVTLDNNNMNIAGVLGYGYESCVVENCYSTGDISCESTSTIVVGGVVALFSGDITNCYNTGDIDAESTGTVYAGGVVGQYQSGGYMTMSYNTGDVTAEASDGAYIGGIAGTNDGSILFSYNTGHVTGSCDAINSTHVGSLIGFNWGNCEKCYALDGAADSLVGSGSVDSTCNTFGSAGYLTNSETTLVDALNAGLESSSNYVWKEVDSEGYIANGLPASLEIATWTDKADTDWYYNDETATSFSISTAAELAGLAYLVNAGEDTFSGDTITLTGNIDLTDHEWTAIGTDSNSFQGTFDGAEKTISGLYINEEYSATTYVGLFGYASGATIKDVTVDGSISVTSSEGYLCVGGVVGESYKANFENITSNVSISAEAQGSSVYVGGIIGYADGGTISNCENTEDVIAGASTDDAYVGGIVGDSYESTVEYCTNSGDVKCTSDSDDAYVGGIVGYNYNGNVYNCTNSGAVTGDGSSSDAYVGGIVGYNYNGMVAYCTNTGEVSDTSNSYACVGGVIGINRNGISVGCTNSGNVSSTASESYVGGIVGRNTGTIYNYENSGEVSDTNVSDDRVYGYNEGTIEILSDVQATGGSYTSASGTEITIYSDGSDSAGSAVGTWQAIGVDYLLGGTLESGNYYLADDFDIYGTLVISGEVNFALNGKTLDANGGDFAILSVSSGGVLNLYGNSDVSAYYYYGDEETGYSTLGGAGEATIQAYDGYTEISGGLITGSERSGTGAGGVNVSSGGTFNMYGGLIEGNTGSAVKLGGTFNMFGGGIMNNEATEGAGVCVSTVGTFNMYGGAILSNEASDGAGVYVAGIFNLNDGDILFNDAADNGAGVYTGEASVFTMTGGNIAYNESKEHGAGVYATGVFDLIDGEIFENVSKDGGGGVYVKGTMTMSGGEISGNTAVGEGGGVYVNDSAAKLSITGGTITRNTAGDGGGGVYIDKDGEVVMSGGVISYNTADNTQNIYSSYSTNDGNGGGVYISKGTFTLSGGTIEYNEAISEVNDDTENGNGGGVYVNYDSATFKMTGGEISNNTAEYKGGGVYVYDEFEMTGGEISSNSASVGGGVYINTGETIEIDGVFTMSGGEISGNTATTFGGGVYLSTDGTFNVSGAPVVSENTVGTYENNVYINKNTITVVGDLKSYAGVTPEISVTLYKVDDSAAAGSVFAEDGGTYTLTADGVQYFSYDEDAFGVYYSDGDYVLGTAGLLSFEYEVISLFYEEGMTVTNALTVDQTVVTVTYSKTGDSTITVDESTGAVTISGSGSVIITASDGTYSTAYALNIFDSPVITTGDSDVEDDEVEDSSLPTITNGNDVTIAVGSSILLNVETQEELPDDEAQTAIATAIEENEDVSVETVEYVDISLYAVVGEESSPLSDSAIVMEIAYPYDLSGKTDIVVYRYHDYDDGNDAIAEMFTALEEKPEAGEYKDKTFYVDSEAGVIYLYTQYFSTYAVGYNTAEVSSTSSGGITISSVYTVAGQVVEEEAEVEAPSVSEPDVDVEVEAEVETPVVVPTVTPTTEAESASSNTWIWILLAIVALGGVVGFVVWKKKK